MQSETLAQEFARLVAEYRADTNGPTGAEAWNLIADFAVENAAAISSALSIEQTQPVTEPAWWLVATDMGKVIFHGHDKARAERVSEMQGRPITPLYAHRPVSALVNAEADADVVERWQPIDTAPRDGTPVDLWGVNHLHPRKTGRRATDVTWGRVRDWLGNERDDWQHGQGDDFEPTHWCPVPAAPLSSLRPAEVGSATKSSGAGGGE